MCMEPWKPQAQSGQVKTEEEGLRKVTEREDSVRQGRVGAHRRPRARTFEEVGNNHQCEILLQGHIRWSHWWHGEEEEGTGE